MHKSWYIDSMCYVDRTILCHDRLIFTLLWLIAEHSCQHQTYCCKYYICYIETVLSLKSKNVEEFTTWNCDYIFSKISWDRKNIRFFQYVILPRECCRVRWLTSSFTFVGNSVSHYWPSFEKKILQPTVTIFKMCNF